VTASRTALLVLAALATLAATTAFAMPGIAMCAAIQLMPLDELAIGVSSDRAMSGANRRRFVLNHAAAVGRIERLFGKPRARPYIVYLSKADALWPLAFNSFGSTSFLPGRSCIVLGPDGSNVDVLAHELVHAEIADRVGYWRRWISVPVWFDEGAGMQVDQRPAFAAKWSPRTPSIINRTTAKLFFGVPPGQLTENYQNAKLVVADWLNRTGPSRFYDRLDEIRTRGGFDAMWSNRRSERITTK